MVSRSRLNKTRGPPDALRIPQNPPHGASQPGGPEPASYADKTTILFIRRRREPQKPAESDRQTLTRFVAADLSAPYSQSRLVLPSKTPARGNNVSVQSMLR